MSREQARQALEVFLGDKALRCRPKTLTNYRNIITLFIDQAAPTWPPTRAEILTWLAEVEARSSRVSAASYWATLRSWLNYLAKAGLLDGSNAAAEIQNLGLAPSRPRTQPKGISLAEIMTLSKYLAELPGLAARRDLALIWTLFFTGMRSGECAGLRRSWLDLEARQVTIPAEQTKTDAARSVYFGIAVRDCLAGWLDQLHGVGFTGPWVFPSFGNASHKPTDKALTISGVNDLWHRRLREAGLPSYSVHSIRHGFCKYALQSRVPLSAVQKQMGHSTSAMTLKYAAIFDPDQRQAFAHFGDGPGADTASQSPARV